MASEFGFEKYDNARLAQVVNPRVTPPYGENANYYSASERTLATRSIGENMVLRQLIAGDWEVGTDFDKQIISELLGRIVTNAERQGININIEGTEV